jgi:DNA/RNA endonuclease YhcR with UshA esterase domain
MKRRLLFVTVAVACLGLVSVSFAQTCQEIHNLGSNGCAPSGLDGTLVTVQGVVYVEAGTYNGGSVYWQCPGGTGGLLFFDYDANPADGLNPVFEGDLIEVTGTVGAFGAEIQLNSATWTVIGSGTATPTSIGTADLADGTDLLGDFMSVEGLLTKVSAGFNSIYEVDDGTGPVLVYVDGTTGIDTALMDAYLGDVVEIRGATKCYNDIGEILPRRDADIILKQVATDNESWGSVKSRF